MAPTSTRLYVDKKSGLPAQPFIPGRLQSHPHEWLRNKKMQLQD